MSASPCLRRVRQLESAGYISRYVAVLNQRRLGLGIVAFVELKVPQVSSDAIVQRFKEAVRLERSIVACYLTAGQFDFVLKVIAEDMDHYSRLTQDVLLRLPGVQDMRSTFVVEAVKDTTELPIS